MVPYGLKYPQRVMGNPITDLFLYLEPNSQLTHYQPFQPLSICPTTVTSDIVSYWLEYQFLGGPTADIITDMYCTALFFQES